MAVRAGCDPSGATIGLLSLTSALREVLEVVGGDAADDLIGPDEEVERSIMAIVKPSFLRVAEEVNKALIYTSSLMRGEGVQKIYLFGGIARWPGADRLLQSLVGMPVEIPNPFAAFLGGAEPEVHTDSYPVAGIALATGYALRGMLDDG